MSTVLKYHVRYLFNMQTICVSPINSSVIYIHIAKLDEDLFYLGELDNMNIRFILRNSGFGSNSAAPVFLESSIITTLINNLPDNRSVCIGPKRNWKTERNQLRNE